MQNDSFIFNMCLRYMKRIYLRRIVSDRQKKILVISAVSI